jgi:hypothetical protein
MDAFLNQYIYEISIGSLSHFCRWKSGVAVDDLSYIPAMLTIISNHPVYY